MKSKFNIVYINIILVCVFLVVIELLGQIIYFSLKGHPLFVGYRYEPVFELHPYLAGRLRKGIRVSQGDKTITTTDDYTRWTGAPSSSTNTIRVAILGGSTTFGTGATDTDTWPALLQDILGDGYSVINYGVPGYSTAEAIIQMALVVPEIKPHIVVLYEGWNDIRNYHVSDLGSDYFAHGILQYGNLQIPVQQNHVIVKLARVSAIFWFAKKIATLLPQLSEGRIHADNHVYRTADPFVDAIYLRNLKTLRILSENMGAYALFTPQVLNYTDFKGKKKSRPWSPHIEDDAMPVLLDRFNAIMTHACPPDKSACTVINEVLTVDWKPSDFVDEGHFSRTGGVKFAEIVARRIREKSNQHSLRSGTRLNATPDA